MGHLRSPGECQCLYVLQKALSRVTAAVRRGAHLSARRSEPSSQHRRCYTGAADSIARPDVQLRHPKRNFHWRKKKILEPDPATSGYPTGERRFQPGVLEKRCDTTMSAGSHVIVAVAGLSNLRAFALLCFAGQHIKDWRNKAVHESR
ncbi:hypothetical protein SKAU_G00408770 [Synaphobranchus kaupii]|uniref:Uncharacterized protein n=1 Tax=Synaphobranchus kaupii TaxID=118154 RepID=A0A9Q1EAF6_SYNKA|nr:hypothetical protein SKAU_G00408770 [Synaphobranchus kaupii]